MSKLVYLSSTLDDLRTYRDAAVGALVRLGFEVKESYKATANPTVEQCLSDVRECDIYVGLFAGRYGSRRPEYGGKSITELEYLEAVKEQKKRFIFIRPLEVCIADKAIDWQPDDETCKALKALRDDLQAGKGHTCAQFLNPQHLAGEITKAFGGTGRPDDLIFRGSPPHPNLLRTGLLVVALRGEETEAERIVSSLPSAWQAVCQPFGIDDPKQRGDDRLRLDDKLAHSRCVTLLLSASGLERLKEKPGTGEDLTTLLNDRIGSYSLLLAGVQPGDVPAGWPPAAASFPLGEWLAAGTNTLGGQLATLLNDFPTAADNHRDVDNPGLVSLSYSVLAMTRDEAQALEADPNQVRDELGKKSYEFFLKLSTRLADQGHWAERYGPQRTDWQPFANGSIDELVTDVVDTINDQTVVPKRDQTALRNNRIRLRYYPFEPSRFKPGSVDWKLLEAMRARGCLMLVDELSTFHPALHGTGDVFLADPAVTVATLSGLDPLSCSLDELIDSPQKINVLVDRFSNKLDPRCELAINNKARIRRWLRLSVPEALSGSEAQGADPERRTQFLATLPGRA